MKIYLLTDLEGAAGITRFNQTRDYTQEDKIVAMKLLTAEVNAAIEGIFSVNSDSEITVWDGHGNGGIDIDLLHPKVRFIPKESNKPPYSLDSNYDALFFIGQHAMSGTEAAPLCHTYSSKTVEYYKLNGKLIGEFGCRAALAGNLNIPTVFISGDDKSVAEAKSLIPNIYSVTTKQGLTRESAIHLSPHLSCELIGKTTAKACKNISSIQPYKISSPFELEIKVYKGCDISWYLFFQGSKKIDERTVLIKTDNLCNLPI